MAKKVLIVEDSVAAGKIISEMCLALGAEPSWAKSLDEAERLLDPKFDVVVWDGYLPDGDSPGLIRQTANWFQGEMVACSTMPALRRKQAAAGCNYSCNKEDLEPLLRQLLSSSEKPASSQ